jgi:hypothetical protein
MHYLRPSIHSVSVCEPLPSAASMAGLYPCRAWSLDMFSARSARKPATASAKLPLSTQISARCFAQVSCSSRLVMRSTVRRDGALARIPGAKDDKRGASVDTRDTRSERDHRHSVNIRGRVQSDAEIGIAFGGRHGFIYQAEDHRCDGGAADGGSLGRAGPRLKRALRHWRSFAPIVGGAGAVGSCVPCGAGVDLLAAARAAAQAPGDVRDVDGRRQGVDDNVGRVVTGFAGCGDGAHAVLAHVGERHGRPGWGAHGSGAPIARVHS